MGVFKPRRMPMARKRDDSLAPKLRRVAERLEAWRKRRGRPRRLPDAIWDAAVELAREHGVTRVARSLRLDYGSLKRRLSEAPAPASPGFVEVCLGKPGANAGWTIELQDGAERRMTMAAPAGSAVDPVALASAFWGAPR